MRRERWRYSSCGRTAGRGRRRRARKEQKSQRRRLGASSTSTCLAETLRNFGRGLGGRVVGNQKEQEIHVKEIHFSVRKSHITHTVGGGSGFVLTCQTFHPLIFKCPGMLVIFYVAIPADGQLGKKDLVHQSLLTTSWCTGFYSSSLSTPSKFCPHAFNVFLRESSVPKTIESLQWNDLRSL